ncbi:hypothetical protein ABZ479_07965 [Streptomyces sp. NPDC005722]
MDDIAGAIVRAVFRGVASLIMDLVGDAVLKRLSRPVRRVLGRLRPRRPASGSDAPTPAP